MKLKVLLIALAICILGILLGTEYYEENCLILPGGLMDSLSEKDSTAGIVVRARENSGISYDIYGYVHENVIYLFLPNTIDMKNIVYTTMDEKGTYLRRFQADLSSEHPAHADYTVIAMQSDIPSMYLEIDEAYGTIQAMNQDEKHQTYTYGAMQIDVSEETAKGEGWQQSYLSQENDGETPKTVKVRGRGNKTWEFEKKPYQIELEKKQGLLGMGAAKKWVLLANDMDGSLLRNQVLYQMAAKMDIPYSVESRPVNLYMNGIYQGCYLLASRVEVGENRVNIDEDQDYLLEWGGTNNTLYIEFEELANMPLWWVKVHSPDSQNAVNRLEPKLKEILSAIMDSSSEKYSELIDLTTWAKCYWVQEFSSNGDGVHSSIYLYYMSNEEKLYMGPMWDLDYTFGNFTAEEYLYPTKWSMRMQGWYVPLFQHEGFRDAVDKVYMEEELRLAFEGALEDLTIGEDQLKDAAVMNYLRWKQPVGSTLSIAEASYNYAAEVETVRKWMQERTIWIDEQMD